MERKVEAARFELALQLIDAGLEHGARQRQRQIREPELEQFLVGQVRPVGGNTFAHRHESAGLRRALS
jgi:hypothetical protein